jgi:2-polyprenyl-6-methoxyphenol hydroxylase-like FAD-dependent oxidoreductase
MDDEKLLKLSSGEAAAETQRMTKHWDASFHILFSAQSIGQSSVIAVDSSKPDIEAWKTQKCVTLLGDAIHAMSPTAGIGSVTAVKSAAALTKAITEGGVNVESLGKYEAEMRLFASEAIRKSFFGGNGMFGLRTFEKLEEKAKKSL